MGGGVTGTSTVVEFNEWVAILGGHYPLDQELKLRGRTTEDERAEVYKVGPVARVVVIFLGWVRVSPP